MAKVLAEPRCSSRLPAQLTTSKLESDGEDKLLVVYLMHTVKEFIFKAVRE